MAPGSPGAPATYPKAARATLSPSTRSCSGWGLPCHACCHARGALLPHLFTIAARVSSTLVRAIRSAWRRLIPLTPAQDRPALRQHGPIRALGCVFSVALSVASRRPAVNRHPALRSPDFPLRATRTQRLSGRLPTSSVARSSSPRRRPDFSCDITSPVKLRCESSQRHHETVASCCVLVASSPDLRRQASRHAILPPARNGTSVSPPKVYSVGIATSPSTNSMVSRLRGKR